MTIIASVITYSSQLCDKMGINMYMFSQLTYNLCFESHMGQKRQFVFWNDT